ncbi:MAG: hypothetical protein QOD74_486 [Variibacter sp.]|jgi:hypothetical protein|nr:hypothetical protein [Variibacter sp.]
MLVRAPTRLWIVVALASVEIYSSAAVAQFATQGGKLVGSNSVGISQQGHAIAISGDGNTMIIGAPFDNNNVGAA